MRSGTVNGGVQPGAVVFVDTNVIIEGYRTDSWAALVGGYGVETVEDCVTETQTGYVRRPREQWIDVADLRASMAAVHEVTDRERAELAMQVSGVALDRGEESLWAHALGRGETWFLCGPDRASIRVGIQLGFRERLVSLEELLVRCGHRPSRALKVAYERAWLTRVVGEIVIGALARR